MAQPTHRGPVEIKGVTTRTCNSDNRYCESEACSHWRILRDGLYERVMRLDGKVEFYHPTCFVNEFGRRDLYGG